MDFIPLTDMLLRIGLSRFLWQESADETLLDAAADGELDDLEGIEKHARRLLDDPKSDRSIRNFHKEWLAIDEGGNSDLEKDMRLEINRFTTHVAREGTLNELWSARYFPK